MMLRALKADAFWILAALAFAGTIGLLARTVCARYWVYTWAHPSSVTEEQLQAGAEVVLWVTLSAVVLGGAAIVAYAQRGSVPDWFGASISGLSLASCSLFGSRMVDALASTSLVTPDLMAIVVPAAAVFGALVYMAGRWTNFPVGLLLVAAIEAAVSSAVRAIV